MSLDSFGLGARRILRRSGNNVEHVLTQRPLHRVLSFTGTTIDDIVNSPLAKNQVKGFYRLYRQIERQGDITELEKQWNRR